MAKLSKLLGKLGLIHDGAPEQRAASPEAALAELEAGMGGAEGPAARPQVRPAPAEGAPAAPRGPKVIRLTAGRFEETVEEDEEPIDYPFEQIYEKAGVESPDHGFTVYKLIEMLEADEIAALPPQARAQAITAMLKHLPGGAVPIDDVVGDAAARDQALDAFEAFLADRLARREAEVEAQNRELQAEIDRIVAANEEAMELNRQRLAEERERMERWRRRKLAEEERLHDAVAQFVADNPVTRAAQPESAGDDGPPSSARNPGS